MRDLEAWWKVELPKRYRIRWDPVQAYTGYTSRASARPPKCGDEARPSYDDEAGNAYYCPDGDFIAWDDEQLLPDLIDQYGPVAVGMVLAHEMGHAVQARAEVDLDQVHYELQADCFAGAWLWRVTGDEPGTSNSVKYDLDTVDEAIAAIVTFSDDAGVTADDENAHGSGFDRVSALQMGYDEGVARCVSFERNPPPVTLAAFSSAAEERNGGNLPLPEMLQQIPPLLTSWWRRTDARVPSVTLRGSTAAGVEKLVRACGGALVFEGVAGVCRATASGRAATVVYDAAALRKVHREDGDFAAAIVLAQSWSSLWQASTRRTTSDRSEAAEQQATCATGAWVRSLGAVGDSGGLSPGDLDEAVYAILELPGPSSAFDAIGALRRGHDRGMAACR